MLLNLNLDVARRMNYRNMNGLSSLRDEPPQYDLSQFPAGSRIVQANVIMGMMANIVWGVLSPDGTFYMYGDKNRGTKNYNLLGGTVGGNSNTGGNTNSTTTNSNEPCPCEDCTEEFVEDTYYLTKQELSGAKQYRTFTNKIVCDSTDNSVMLPCEDEIAKLRGGTSSGPGMNGLNGIKVWDSKKYDDCVRQLNEGVDDPAIRSRNRRTCFAMTGGILAKNPNGGDFGLSYEQHIAQANRLSLKDGVSGCKSCGVSGLANDNTPIETNDGANSTTVYYTNDTATLPAPCGCGKAAFNMWAWIASLVGVAFLTWIITYMATKKR